MSVAASAAFTPSGATGQDFGLGGRQEGRKDTRGGGRGLVDVAPVCYRMPAAQPMLSGVGVPPAA